MSNHEPRNDMERVFGRPVARPTRPTLASSTLRFVTVEEAEAMMLRGSITQDQYEGYMHSWTTSAPRFADYAVWQAHTFTTHEAEAVALELGCCKF